MERLSLVIDDEGQLWVDENVEIVKINPECESVNGYNKADSQIPPLLDFVILCSSLVILTQDGRVGCWNKIYNVVEYIEIIDVIKIVLHWGTNLHVLDNDGTVYKIEYQYTLHNKINQLKLLQVRELKIDDRIIDMLTYNYIHRMLYVGENDEVIRSTNDHILSINDKRLSTMIDDIQLTDDVIDITGYRMTDGVIVMLLLYDDNYIKLFNCNTREMIVANIDVVVARFIYLQPLNVSLIEDIEGDLYRYSIDEDYGILLTRMITPGRLIQQSRTTVRSAYSYR